MTISNKTERQGKFAKKGRDILGRTSSPGSMEEFLDGPKNDGETITRNPVKSSNRSDGKPESRQAVKLEDVSKRTERLEFRCVPELAGRLDRYVLEQNQSRESARKIKRVDVIQEAIEGFLKKKGF